MPRYEAHEDTSALTDRLEDAPPPDPEQERRARRRRLLRRSLIGLGVVVVLGGITFLSVRNRTTVVSVDDSLDRFRAGAGATPSAAGETVPEFGVYVYRTEGEESVGALGGARHVFPSETTITVSPHPCGWTSHWQAIGERWEDVTICSEPGSMTVRELKTFHRFFGKSDERAYFCGSNSLYLPRSDAPGTTWNFTCSGSDTTARARGEVVGTKTLDVDGTSVNVLHYRLVTTFEGATKGTRVSEFWVTPDTGLVVKTTHTDDVETDSAIGFTHYEERVELILESLTPRT